MVQGGSMKKGSSSKGGSSSQKLSDKKMRKMEARVLEEKLVTLRAAVFEPDGKDRNVCAPLAPFMKYDRNGLDCTIEFYSKLPADAKLWAFELVKANMEELYDEAGYGWDDQDKLSELSEDGTRFLVARNKSGERIAFAHFRFTVQGDVVDQMRGDTVLMVHDLHVVDDCQRKGLGRHLMTLMEMVARKTNMSRVSTMCMMGDENTRAFLSKLKKGAFAPDESMVDVCGFDPDLEGFEVISLALAMPPKPPVEEEEEVDEEAELAQAKQLVLEKVTQAFAQKHGRDPTQQERAAIAAAAEAKLQGFTTGSQTGKERRTANREAREKASAAFEKAEGRKPTPAELDEVLAVVAPEAIQTPAKAPPSEVESPTCVADVPV